MKLYPQTGGAFVRQEDGSLSAVASLAAASDQSSVDPSPAAAAPAPAAPFIPPKAEEIPAGDADEPGHEE